jgi:predicted DNA-binding transcriptional regulator YafY
LIAWHTKRKVINTFGLDRIESINKTGKYFEKISDFTAQNYFKDAFGITAPQKLKTRTVILSFSPAQGNYIRTQALHNSQEIVRDNDEEFRISLKVMLSYELKAQILSYGASVRVLKPKGLSKEIKAEIEAMKKNY